MSDPNKSGMFCCLQYMEFIVPIAIHCIRSYVAQLEKSLLGVTVDNSGQATVTIVDNDCK